MKVLFLVRSLDVGGGEMQLAFLARGLHERGHAVQVATLYPGRGRIWDALVASGVRCIHLEKRSRWDVSSPFRRLTEIARDLRPDVVYSFMPAANVLAALARSRLSPSALVWGVRSARMDWNFYGFFPKVLLRLERSLSARPDLIICNSHAGRRYHSEAGWQSSRMTVVENGIDVAQFFPDVSARALVREELRVPPTRNVVGIVGRLDPVKDHASFLRMAATLLSQRDDCEFWCIGGGSDRAYRERLDAYAHELGISASVRWLGARPNMRAIYSAMDVTCLTSLAEGFPNVVGESMACGTPCAVFDIGDAASIVNDPKLVVAQRSSPRLADAVHWALDQADRLRSQVRARIVGSFSLTRLIDRTENCLLGVAAAPARQT
jgi:glycosyltransferase involved in cell wall biosynthesis